MSNLDPPALLFLLAVDFHMETMPSDGLETIAAHMELSRMCKIVKANPGIEAHAGYIIKGCWRTEDNSFCLGGKNWEGGGLSGRGGGAESYAGGAPCAT